MAVPLVSNTSTTVSVADGLLRTSTGCAGPSFSLTLYVDCTKLTVITKRNKKKITVIVIICTFILITQLLV